MGLELELLLGRHLPPIRTPAAVAAALSSATTTTTRAADGDDDSAFLVDGCATPKSAAHALPPVCPPAPRKPRPPAGKIRKLQQRRARRCGPAAAGAQKPAAVRWFIAVPQDVLAAVFVARRPAAAPCPTSSPPSKKIRVHVAG